MIGEYIVQDGVSQGDHGHVVKLPRTVVKVPADGYRVKGKREYLQGEDGRALWHVEETPKQHFVRFIPRNESEVSERQSRSPYNSSLTPVVSD